MPRGKGTEALRRRKASPWPWVVGFFVLLLGIWLVTFLVGDDSPREDPSQLTSEQADMPEPVVVPAPADQ